MDLIRESVRSRRAKPPHAVLNVSIAVLMALLLAGCESTESPLPRTAVRVTTVTEDGGRVAWSHRLNRIAFDRAGNDGYYDVYTMTPDGSDVTCVTCDRPGLPARHNGNPAWHPDGTFIVFQAQKEDVTGLVVDGFAKPGLGVNNDLWLIDTAGRGAWRLTDVPALQGGVLHPHFSHAGDRLLWSERIGGGGRFGEWALKIADFRVEGSTPRLGNVRTFQPGAQRRFYESHGFSPDDRQIYFSGNLQPGQDEIHLDIYRMDVDTGALVNLTPDAQVWDEHAHPSPSGARIVWISSRGLSWSDPSNLRTEFWMMQADGSAASRLTFFNEPGRAESIPGGAVAADFDWSPNGTRLIAYVIRDNLAQTGRIVMIELGSEPVSITTELPESSSRFGPPSPQASRAYWDDETKPGGRPDDAGGLVLVSPATTDELMAWNDRLEQMRRSGELELAETMADTVLAGRWHERYEQRHHGLPVFGAGASRQTDGRRVVSLFGTLYRGIDVDTTPAFSRDRARERLERLTGMALGGTDRVELMVLPRGSGGFALAYVGRVASPTGIIEYFLDARTGAVILQLDEARQQRPASSRARPVPFGAEDVPTTRISGRDVTADASRPPGILTFDMRGDLAATLGVLNGTRPPSWSDLGEADPARSGDTAVLDAHRHAAITYDYLLDRFGHQGMCRSVQIVNLVHPLTDAERYPAAVDALFGRSAFYAGRGIIVYGGGSTTGRAHDGTAQHMARGLDIVAHEIAHGILDCSSRLASLGESAALKEAFADIIATSVEARARPFAGRSYVVGKDVVPGGLRSLQAPASFGQADHYAVRVHDTHPLAPFVNAGIPGHVFWLAIEGGVHPRSNIAVPGVGPKLRENVERVFYRTLAWMLPPLATFPMARAATLQASRDLYGPGNPVEVALERAWTAVGVN
jgi:thermolysin